MISLISWLVLVHKISIKTCSSVPAPFIALRRLTASYFFLDSRRETTASSRLALSSDFSSRMRSLPYMSLNRFLMSCRWSLLLSTSRLIMAASSVPGKRHGIVELRLLLLLYPYHSLFSSTPLPLSPFLPLPQHPLPHHFSSPPLLPSSFLPNLPIPFIAFLNTPASFSGSKDAAGLMVP